LYCACNRKITRNHEIENDYIDALLAEWQLYLDQELNLTVERIHLGGGTPTFLTPQGLGRLLGSLLDQMNVTSDFFGSIEIDPRVTTREHIKVLTELGFKKFSLGVQDFDPNVQKVINRIQPHQMVSKTVEMLRELGVEYINFDLIYGLPLQTEQTITDTFNKVIEYKPSSIAYYSYAKVPWKFAHQKALEKYPSAEGEQKRELYNLGKTMLKEAGYHDLGLDHFSETNDPLYQSHLKGKMKRNFMGHTDSKADILIGLGSTAISYSGLGYIQNDKEYRSYQEKIMGGELSFFTGHGHSLLDLEIYTLIQELMSVYHCNLSKALMLLSREDAAKIMAQLSDLKEDGIIEMSGANISITNEGKPFVRVVCKALDYHFFKGQSDARFSKNS
jgi:oxygen-independent coproporphyrinogen-3 oxidase